MTKLLFDGEKAFKYIEKMAVDIGTRPSGSEAERKTADWIASEFKAMGLKTSIEEFEVTTGRVVSQKLDVLEPKMGEIPCEVMPLYGSTGPEGVTGDLVYIETYDEEYLTPDIEGKIILTSGRPQDRKKSYRLLSKYKPLAMIFIESSPRVLAKNLWGSHLIKEKYGELPALRVSFMDGRKLVQSGAKRVHVIAETESKTVNSQNVIAEIEGNERPEEIIVVGGHYDTVLEVSGAGDNAGGTAIAMELARVFKEKGTKRTMKFAAWGCEEVGLLGSRDYATKLRKASEEAKKENEDEDQTELDRTVLCVNLDVHGGFLGTNSSRTLGPPELKTSIMLLSKETGTVFTVNEGVYSSDGTSLSAVGIPSVSFSRGTPSNTFMHSIEDDISWLNPRALHSQGRFIEEYLTRYVAEAAAFPFERKIPEKQKKEIEDYFKRSMRGMP
jgi:Iap family predicted aminopeptidase